MALENTDGGPRSSIRRYLGNTDECSWKSARTQLQYSAPGYFIALFSAQRTSQTLPQTEQFGIHVCQLQSSGDHCPKSWHRGECSQNITMNRYSGCVCSCCFRKWTMDNDEDMRGWYTPSCRCNEAVLARGPLSAGSGT